MLRAFGVPFGSETAPGTDLEVTVASHPLFGPVLALSLGGLYGEVLNDKSTRVIPLTDRDAAEMVRDLKSFPLLEGYKGHLRGDITVLEDLLLRVSRLVEEVLEVSKVSLSVRVFAPGEGLRVLDARIEVDATYTT